MKAIAPVTTPVLVEIVEGHPTTTSLDVAAHFGKQHKTVLRAIANLECTPEFHERNFAPMSVEVEIGNGATRSSPAFRMTRDGFTFLCMGFTGKEAAKWKEAYINAFNQLEQAALKGSPPVAQDVNVERRPLRGRHVLIAYMDGQLWLSAGNLCTALDLGASDRVVRSLADQHKRKLQRGVRQLWMVDADGARRAADYCKPETAAEYRQWLQALLDEFSGEVHPARKPKLLTDGLSGDQQEAIKALVKARVDELPEGKRAKAAITCWSSLKSKFGCTYKEIAPEHFTDAVSLIARVALEGELLDPEEPKVVGRLDINYPIEDWQSKNPQQFRRDDPNSSDLLVGYGDLLLSKYSPCLELLDKLHAAGYCIDGAYYEFRSYQNLMAQMDMTVRMMAGSIKSAFDNFEHDRRRLQMYPDAKGRKA